MDLYSNLQNRLQSMKESGTYKEYQYLTTPMSNKSNIEKYNEVIVLCSNNYIGLCNNKEIIQAGHEALDKYGVGAASVRFICGTYDIHRQLEKETADFMHAESCLTYMTCWNANTGVIPAILFEGDCIISDALNHASIIDGCRMVNKKVEKFVYKHSDMEELERLLKDSDRFNTKLVITDGVFSMEGDIAKLDEIYVLCKKYGAILMVDDSHGMGVIGKTGRGAIEYHNLLGKIDIITGTYGKALGGSAGGFVAAKQEVIDMCIQASRTSLFTNSLPPVVAAMALKSIQILKRDPSIIESLHKKVKYLRQRLHEEGFEPLEGDSAIVPIIVKETAKAIKIAKAMLKKNVYVTGFGFPVVPEGTARIRIQVSDALSYEDIDYAVKAFKEVFDNVD